MLLQVLQVKSDLAVAKSAAAQEAKRAATLQQDLEHLQEQATRAAVYTVDELVGDLTQGQETEDDNEQPAQPQRGRANAGSDAAGKRAAVAAKRKQGKASAKGAAAAATPVVQTAVFSSGPAAELSEIEEGDEEGNMSQDGDMSHQQAVQQQQQLQQTQEEQEPQQQEAAAGGRRPRSAKLRAQQHIKAAAAADITPPSEAAAAAAEDAADERPEPLRRVSPHSK